MGYLRANAIEKYFEAVIDNRAMVFAEVPHLFRSEKERPSEWSEFLTYDMIQNGSEEKRTGRLTYPVAALDLAGTIKRFHQQCEKFLAEIEYINVGSSSPKWAEWAIMTRARLQNIQPKTGERLSEKELKILGRGIDYRTKS